MRDDFDVRFPEFAGLTDREWQAATSLYPLFFKYDYGLQDEEDLKILFLLAHLLITLKKVPLSDTMFGAEKISGKTVGNVSVTYGVTPLTSNEQRLYGDFKATTYGNMYLSLLTNSFKRGGVFI